MILRRPQNATIKTKAYTFTILHHFLSFFLFYFLTMKLKNIKTGKSSQKISFGRKHQTNFGQIGEGTAFILFP
jgi:hypothetical protein